MGIMKTKIIVFLLLLSSFASAQMTAKYIYEVQLSTTDSIDTNNWLNGYPFKELDTRLINKYKGIICKEIRSYVTQAEVSDNDIADVLNYNLSSAYYLRIDGILYHTYKYYNLFHSKIQNKNFRDFLFNKACDILCELIALYPVDFQYKIETEIESALDFLGDMPNHHYEIKEDVRYSSQPLTIFVDGEANDAIAFTINGFLLRRMLMDNISYDEIVQRLQIVLQKVSEIDNSDNADYAVAYLINNEIIYYISCLANYFATLENDEYFMPYKDEYYRLYVPNVVKCRQNFGQNFYIISNRLWTDSEYTHTVVDKYMNIIYQE